MSNFDSILSPKLLYQSNLSIELSSIIFNLSSDNIELTMLNFLEFIEDLGKEDLEIINLLNIIQTFIRIRSSKSLFLCQFLKRTENSGLKTDSFDIKDFNHNQLLDKMISFDDDYKIRPCNMYFLTKSIETKLFSIIEILNKINEYYKTHQTFYYVHILHFAWFAPEISRYDQNLFNSYSKSIQKLREMTKWEPSLEPFFSHFESMKENDWNQLKLCREGSESTVFQIFENDSAEFIQTHEMLNLNKVYSINIYNPMLNVSTGNASLLEISAYFGSIRCFKYLTLNDAKLRDGEALTSVAFGRFHLSEHWNTMNFAVAGGNAEIIHLIENKKGKFNNCLNVAIQFYQYSIFEWIFGQEKDENLDLFVMIQNCIAYNNVKSLLLILDWIHSQKLNDNSAKDFEGIKFDDKKIASRIVSEFINVIFNK